MNRQVTRRRLLQGLGATGATLLFSGPTLANQGKGRGNGHGHGRGNGNERLEPAVDDDSDDDDTPEDEPERDWDGSDEIFNVRDYGAAGDGRSDATVAVQRAIKAAQRVRGTVHFPAGTYRITDTVFVDSSVRIRGEGIDVSEIYGAPLPLINASGSEGVTFVDIAITGTNPDDWVYGLIAGTAVNLSIHRCRFENLYAGVHIENSSSVWITECFFQRIKGSAVRLHYTEAGDANQEIYIRNNRFLEVNYAGLSGNSAVHAHCEPGALNEYVWIEDNYIESGGIGLGLDAIDHSVVARNRVIGNRVEGECIAFTGSNNQILDNEVNNAYAAGILIWAVAYRDNDNNLIQGNTCYDNSQGIAVVCGERHAEINGLEILENRCFAYEEGSRQQFGVQAYIDGTDEFTWRHVLVADNDLRGNTVSAYHLMPPAEARIERNLS